MNTYIGTYGYIKDGTYVIECSDSKFNWNEANWWHAHLWCIHDCNGILTLKSREGNTIRVRKEGYDILGFPKFHIGDKVTVKATGKSASIASVNWHDMRESFFYTLDYGNRISTNRFFDRDIEEV